MPLSGLVSPIDNMRDWLQTLTVGNPLRDFLVIICGVFLKDLPASEVLADAAPLVIIAAAWLFNQRSEWGWLATVTV